MPKWIKKNKIKKLLFNYRKNKFENDGQVEEVFTQHKNLKEIDRVVSSNRFDDVRNALGKFYKDEETDIPGLLKKVSAISVLSVATNKWQKNGLEMWAAGWKAKGISHTDEVIQAASNGMGAFVESLRESDQGLNKYHSLTGLNILDNPCTKNWLLYAKEKLQELQMQLPQLKNWMNYANVRKEGTDMNLRWLVNAFEEDRFVISEMPDVFYFNMYLSIAEYIIAQHEPLTFFNRDLYEQKIELYRKVSKEFLELTQRELTLKLAAKVPNTAVEAMQSSEIGILQRAIKNKARGLSIRKLFDQIPTLLPRIAPCMLMSPISVAQYFDVSTDHFDLVIFDEASQLPTCEAVSALARAKQAIIVGDPRQMPPTSFFTTNKVDEENLEVEDLESILDDCLSLSMPSRYLLRHYRSKHESLIAFSNVNYYDNKLLTFPSADDLNRKVKYHHIEGFYDTGKTRQNKFEADAIVRHIKKHLEDKQKRKLSIGVVTFSQTQQNLVEDKLQELFLTSPKLEKVATESAEPIFIKNLENVQGDERDIILFSICYAPDEEGKMIMNFGPINRDGGWRRLNVAITRAREEMHVFEP